MGTQGKLKTIYLPWVATSQGTSYISESERLAHLILEADWQQRKHGEVNHLLMKAAQYKADQMAALGYFSHISPTGEAPNDYVRAHGYVLPDWYPVGKNNIESIALGAKTPEEAIQLWLASPTHKTHLAGEIAFYAGQEQVGVGIATRPDGARVWVFLSAPSME